MARLTVRPFERGDLDAAAVLLADAHRRDRDRHPVLAAALADAARVREALAKRLDHARTDGAVAIDGGRLAGFAIGERAAAPPPDSYMGQLAHPRSVTIGCVVGEGVDRHRRVHHYQRCWRSSARYSAASARPIRPLLC